MTKKEKQKRVIGILLLITILTIVIIFLPVKEKNNKLSFNNYKIVYNGEIKQEDNMKTYFERKDSLVNIYFGKQKINLIIKNVEKKQTIQNNLYNMNKVINKNNNNDKKCILLR